MYYVASKVQHATMWKQHRDQGVPIVSTWIDEAEPGQTKDLGELWVRIKEEIRRCDGLVFYAAPNELLKGAFVEVGMALALDKPVVAVINMRLEGRTHYPIGSWLDHPQVMRAPTVTDAFFWLSLGEAALQRERNRQSKE